MVVVRIRAQTADGRVVIGPVRGRGGMVGTGSLHAGYQVAAAAAATTIARSVRLATKQRDTGLYEPEPGHVAMYPDFCAESDGEPVIVPLLGTSWSVCSQEGGEVEC